MNQPDIMEFPESVLIHVDAERLPRQDRAPIEAYRIRTLDRNSAANALKIWEAKQDTGIKEEVGDYMVWRDPDESLKASIKRDPMTALRCYFINPTWWTPRELVEVVRKSPEAAYWTANKVPLTGNHLYALQEAAGRGRPDLAYHFFKEIPNASQALAMQSLADHPYWQALVSSDTTEEKENRILARAAYDPEAASYVIFREEDPENETTAELMRMALATLELYPEWAYKTATHLKAGSQDPRRDRLKMAAMRQPKWAYHWTRSFQPESAMDNVSYVWNHPGWAAELVRMIAKTRGQEAYNQAFQIVLSHCQQCRMENDPWFMAFLMASTDNLENQ